MGNAGNTLAEDLCRRGEAALRNVLGGGGRAGELEAGMCLVTNEGRAPARTAGLQLRLPRPLAARLQVAGEGAAAAPRG